MKPLESLLERAKSIEMSPSDLEKQRQSFAYGNTRIENTRITRATVRQASEKLAAESQSTKRA